MRVLVALLTISQVAAIPAGLHPHQKRQPVCEFAVTVTDTVIVTGSPATITYTASELTRAYTRVVEPAMDPQPADETQASNQIVPNAASVPSSGAIFVQLSTAPLSTSAVTASASVISTTVSSGLAQVLVASSSGTITPGTTGLINTKLQTLITSNAILSTSIAPPSSTISVAPTVSPVSSLPSSAIVMKASNIFQAVATDAPPAIISRRSDHPVARLGIESQASPLSTNKFYANFFLGSQSAPSFTFPYSVAWAKGSGNSKSWGLSISHIDANQRVFGPENTYGDASYFINPVGIQSVIISALELGSSTALSSSDLTAFSMNLHLHAASGTAAAITFPLVQGMVFTTGIYQGATPILNTGVLFRTLTLNPSPKAGVTKYTLVLEDGKTWFLYATSADGASITFSVISNTLIQATSNFNGYLQVAKAESSADEALYDTACGAFATTTSISGSTSGTTGSYTLTFEQAGISNATLAMFALPHHLESFDQSTAGAVSTVQLQTTTKGLATAVLGSSWTLVEQDLPTTMGFAPWSPTLGSVTALSVSAQAAMMDIAASEVSQNMLAQSDLDSFYYSGKALYKFAQIVYTINDLLGNKTLAQAGLVQLKSAFAVWASNTNEYPLVYDSAWGGVVSSASYVTGNSGVDFGNTYYNDHHFHYAYFVGAAAIIGYLDPTWLTANKDYVNTMVRDYANPSTDDNYFPVSRAFDFYHGHSWAHGLYETFDGKNEESSSEDVMSAYAIKMWGRTIGDKNMEARGNLQLAITARSLQNYFLYDSTNCVQPSNFIGNKVSGILFENKVDHTTYFGTNIEYIQGIHMIPLIPASTLSRTTEFVTEEWNKYFSSGRASAIVGGWKGILYANLAIIDPVTSWNFFASSSFDVSWLDGGASRTWYMALAAGLGGA